MLSQNERKRIIALINREVVPAIGCTEPIAVALCTARAAELLGSRPEKVAVRLSANILKNAMGVGIPGTGMIGLPIAVALGALVGRSEYRLEVLRDVTPGAVEQGRRYIDEKRVCIDLKQGIAEKLYIEVEARGAGHCATAVIAGGHTSFVYLERDGEVTLDKRTASAAEEDGGEVPLTLHRVWEFATTAPLDELRFILETTPPEQGRRRAGFRRGVRPLRRAYAPLRARTEDYGRQHLLADTVLYLRGVRRPHGRGDDPRDE